MQSMLDSLDLGPSSIDRHEPHASIHMVEGHGVHRTARAHQTLVGQRLTASSPNGRFTEGAAKIDKLCCTKVEAIGKNMFLWFGKTAKHTPVEAIIVHVHFGMSGQFHTSNLNEEPETKATTRLVLKGKQVSMVSCQTLDYGDLQFYEAWVRKLGPDPLREDADPERLWTICQKSKKTIGLLLMTQEAVAGIGNIYRAEILFKARIHPMQIGNTLSRQQFDSIWNHSVDCLKRGFSHGSIITVDEADAKKLGSPWTRRYVYNHSTCGFCKSSIKSWDMAGRTCYACETCQPLHSASSHKPKPAKEFVSHCAPEVEADVSPSKMTVVQLKQLLSEKGLSTTGTKATLVVRLSEKETIKPGTKGLTMVSAREAAEEKSRAGEKRNVEHISLVTDPVIPKKRRSTQK
jgi:formamidopyrimidine-DNA glycosylase